MTDIRKMIIGLLERYPEKKRKMEQLRYELDNPAQIGENELIESLSFPTSGESRASSHVSNKTMKIALHYQDTLRHMNFGTVTEIVQDLRTLESEIGRIEHYVSLLEELKSHIIRMLYFERKSFADLENENQYSRSTLYRNRNEAIDNLVSMYMYLDKIKGKGAENRSQESA